MLNMTPLSASGAFASAPENNLHALSIRANEFLPRRQSEAKDKELFQLFIDTMRERCFTGVENFEEKNRTQGENNCNAVEFMKEFSWEFGAKYYSTIEAPASAALYLLRTTDDSSRIASNLTKRDDDENTWFHAPLNLIEFMQGNYFTAESCLFVEHVFIGLFKKCQIHCSELVGHVFYTTNKDGDTPAHIAARVRALDALQFILDQVSGENGLALLFEIKNNEGQSVADLIEEHINDFKDNYYVTKQQYCEFYQKYERQFSDGLAEYKRKLALQKEQASRSPLPRVLTPEPAQEPSAPPLPVDEPSASPMSGSTQALSSIRQSLDGAKQYLETEGYPARYCDQAMTSIKRAGGGGGVSGLSINQSSENTTLVTAQVFSAQTVSRFNLFNKRSNSTAVDLSYWDGKIASIDNNCAKIIAKAALDLLKSQTSSSFGKFDHANILKRDLLNTLLTYLDPDITHNSLEAEKYSPVWFRQMYNLLIQEVSERNDLFRPDLLKMVNASGTGNLLNDLNQAMSDEGQAQIISRNESSAALSSSRK